MRTIGAVALHTIHQAALSIWLGGILTLGAVLAPALFGTARQAGDTRWGMPLYDFAGTAIGVAFGRFNHVVLGAGAVMLLAGLAGGALARHASRWTGIRALLTGIAWGLAAWLTFSLYPEMIALREAGRMEAFNALHRTYSTTFSIQMLLLLAVAALTGWLHLSGRGPGAREASPRGAEPLLTRAERRP